MDNNTKNSTSTDGTATEGAATEDTAHRNAAGGTEGRNASAGDTANTERTGTAPEGVGTDAADPAQGPAGTIAGFFRSLFGLDGWGDAPQPPPYPSGPVPRSEGGLAARRLADPEGRFHYAAMMAEVVLLPMMVARDADERDRVNAEIALIVGLGEAAEKGWIAGYTVCWSQGAYPRAPTAIRVRTAPGRRTREQVLGSLEPQIRKFISRASSPAPGEWTRAAGGRPGPPPRH